MQAFNGFLTSLQFLTIIPIKIKELDFEGSISWFPIIGCLIGSLLGGTGFLFGCLPKEVNTSLIIIISIVITGALHLDGFCDTLDGLSSTKEKALEIMKDSRIGSFGVIGIFCLLLLKFALLLNVETLWKSLILMCIFSRFFQVFCCFFSTYPKNSGTGKAFIGYRKKKGIIFGFLFTMLFFLLLDKIGGIILFFTSIIPPILFFLYIKRRIGGMTGDTIGACSEIAEVSFLLFCCLFNIS